MIERPILMSAPMVLACRRDENPKTQTRRVVTPANIRLFMGDEVGCKAPTAELLAAAFEWAQNFRRFEGVQIWDAKAFPHQAPQILTRWQGHSTFGKPGDALWVRETLRRSEFGPWVYRADDEPVEMGRDDPRITEMVAWAHHKEGDTCVSIHMPRWACRLRLRVTDVRVERLNEISVADALAEGLVDQGDRIWGWEADGPGYGSPRAAYAALWEHINGHGSWAANPFVWAVSFERI